MFKNLEKIDVFWDFVFGSILGGFWEAKNLDFRTFFDVFSKSFLKRVSKRPKIAPSRPKRRRRQNFGAGLRWGESSWGEKKRGYKISAACALNLDIAEGARHIKFGI